MELTARKKQILKVVTERYIDTAELVGSKFIAQSMGGSVSSATIRNELADLVEMGYLEQPHTSAGRVPSPKGYRLYVNELMEKKSVSAQEAAEINEALQGRMQGLDNVIAQAGQVVSSIVSYPAYAVASGKSAVTIRRYDLLPVDGGSFIAVVMTDSSVVKNKLIRMPDQVSDPQLQMLSTVLNNAFVGLTQEEMEDTLDKMETRSAPGAFALISQPFWILAFNADDFWGNLWNLNIFFTLLVSLLSTWGFQTRRWWLFVLGLVLLNVVNFDYAMTGLILMMIFRPGGLLGSYDFSLSRIISKVLSHGGKAETSPD